MKYKPNKYHYVWSKTLESKIGQTGENEATNKTEPTNKEPVGPKP